MNFRMSRKCKRKNLMYLSTIGMGIFAAIISVQMLYVDRSAQSLFLRDQVKVEPSSEISSSNYLLLVCILGYICLGSIGVLIIPWILSTELFPAKFKAKFNGFCLAIAYSLMSVVIKSFPFFLETISSSGVFTILPR